MVYCVVNIVFVNYKHISHSWIYHILQRSVARYARLTGNAHILGLFFSRFHSAIPPRGRGSALRLSASRCCWYRIAYESLSALSSNGFNLEGIFSIDRIYTRVKIIIFTLYGKPDYDDVCLYTRVERSRSTYVENGRAASVVLLLCPGHGDGRSPPRAAGRRLMQDRLVVVVVVVRIVGVNK